MCGATRWRGCDHSWRREWSKLSPVLCRQHSCWCGNLVVWQRSVVTQWWGGGGAGGQPLCSNNVSCRGQPPGFMTASWRGHSPPSMTDLDLIWFLAALRLQTEVGDSLTPGQCWWWSSSWSQPREHSSSWLRLLNNQQCALAFKWLWYTDLHSHCERCWLDIIIITDSTEDTHATAGDHKEYGDYGEDDEHYQGCLAQFDQEINVVFITFTRAVESTLVHCLIPW